MSNESAVINNFKKEVNEHFEIIKDCVKRDSESEAREWTDELLIIRDAYENVLKERSIEIKTGSFARGWKVVVDSEHKKEMAKLRFDYVNEVLALIQQMLMKKGWL